MLRAIDEKEWCSDLRGAVMLRLASESGFMLASRADIDKGKTERESRKVVTNRYTDGNGNARKEITSDYILETMQAEIDKQGLLSILCVMSIIFFGVCFRVDASSVLHAGVLFA
ncbi:expressed unknown protein [Ectocarpus siliculosus]|uniref:Uncharacterized protein n=1 Tax=Ectocarpus siliculosus TaxID=2880 RepID=D7FZI3_ECTSI|nr:expressed unknown protein [Ectocarpus siliculosus]|eukprot:CBJ32790.1 expressed unknown protein [Ectocarpus siliculosus]